MKRLLCLLLVLTFLIPAVALAAAPMKLSKTSATLYLNEDNKTGTKKTIDLNIKNRPTDYKSKYTFKWYTDDAEVEVSKGGVVTAKKVGQATVKCDIKVKKTGKTKTTLKCVVTVNANAKTIVIKNAPENNEMIVGEKFDFDRSMKAADGGKATDKTEWSVSKKKIGTISDSGLFTATAPGKVQIFAKAYQSAKTLKKGYTAESEPVTINVKPIKPQNLWGVQPSSMGASDGKICGTVSSMEYDDDKSFNNPKNCENKETKNVKEGTYYVRYKKGDDYEASGCTEVVVPMGAPYALEGTVEITGEEKFDSTLTAKVNETNNTGTLLYQWKRAGEDIAGASENKYKLSEADIGKTLACEVRSDRQTGFIISAATGTIGKADGPKAPEGLTGVAPSAFGGSDGKINGTTVKMEYSKTDDFASATDCADGATTGLTPGTYYVRLKETATHKVGKHTSVTVKEGEYIPEEPEKISAPTFNPAGGTYIKAQRVAISCIENGATIRYTTDGTEPTENSAVYENAIEVSSTSTVKAKAFKTGMANSDTAVAKFIITYIDAAISPASATFDKNAAGDNHGDKAFALNPGSYALSGIALDGEALTVGTDYAVSGETYTVKMEKLATLSVGGGHTLTFDMDGGADPEAALTVVDSTPPALSGTVTISGVLKFGKELTAAFAGNSITGGTLSYKWKRGGATGTNIGTNSDKYTLVKEDIGNAITCVVTSDKQDGSVLGTTDGNIDKADGPAAPSGLVVVAPSVLGGSDGKITGTTAEMQYSKTVDFASATDCADNETTGLAAGTYYVRVKETDTAKAGAYASMTISEGIIPALSGTVNITGVEAFAGTLTVKVNETNNTGTLSYQWKRGGATGTNIGTNSSQYVIIKEDIGNVLACVVTSSVQTGTISGTTDGNIDKADGPAAPSGLVGVAPSVSGGSDGKITGTTDKMQYSKTVDFASATNCGGNEITGLTAGTYYVRVKETDTTKVGAYASVTIPDGIPPVLSGTVNITGEEAFAGTLTAALVDTNNTGTLSYQWKRGGATGTNIGTNSDKYTIVKEDIGNFLACVVTSSVQTGSVFGTTDGSIVKADGPAAPVGLVGVAPSVLSGSDGKITGTKAGMEYSNTTDFQLANNCQDEATVGLTAGTYYVRYKATEEYEAGNYCTVTVPTGAPVAASVDPSTAVFDKYENSTGYADKTFTLTPGSYTLSSVKLDGGDLTATSDYTVNDGAYTIKKEKLAELAVGNNHTITFDMSGGQDPVVTLAITEAPDRDLFDMTVETNYDAKDGTITINGNVDLETLEFTAATDSDGNPCDPDPLDGYIITSLGKGDYYFRYKATSTLPASGYTTVYVGNAQPDQT